MSARYGSRTRTGEAVSDLGRRPTGGGGGGLNVYEEEFLAPGTWTWPGNCSFVECLVVGGGGGGYDPAPPLTNQSFAGGGGGVAIFTVPVSAPVPVTVGAGGAAGTPVSAMGSPGGISGFGPTAPGFPPLAAVVGGGIGADQPGPSTFPTHGYAGSDDSSQPTSRLAGRYGRPSLVPGATATTAIAGGAGGSLVAGSSAPESCSLDLYGYGAGGKTQPTHSGAGRGVLIGASVAATLVPVIANTGQGGSGGLETPIVSIVGGDGSSGIVIVRWSE